MVRVGWLVVAFGIAFGSSLAHGDPPVVAPKPETGTRVTGCPACRFLPGLTSPRQAIVPIVDGPEIPPRGEPPEPLPLPDDATVLSPPEPSATLRELLDRYLPDASADERGVWADELRHLPTEVARDLLAARSSLGEPRPLPQPPEMGLVPPHQTESTEPIELAPLRNARQNRSPRDATLAILKQAEAVLLHNVANAGTGGYKRLRPLTNEASGIDGLAGISVARLEDQGELEPTGRPYDLAIDGPGLFQVRRGEVVALTRRGAFRLTAEGDLALDVAGEDWLLQPPLQIPPEATDLMIDESGRAVCRLPGNGEVNIGQIELARVADLSRLEAAGGGLLAVPESAGRVTAGLPGDDGFGAICQACLEQSNVELTAELAALEKLRRQIGVFERLIPSQLAMPNGVRMSDDTASAPRQTH